jgi:hypothetical protein
MDHGSRPPVRELAERFDRDYVATKVRPRTAEGYRSQLRRQLSPLARLGLALAERLAARVTASIDLGAPFDSSAPCAFIQDRRHAN